MDDVVWPRRRQRRLIAVVLVGLAGAAPTLAWAASRPLLFLDDWAFAAAAKFDGAHLFVFNLRTRPGLSRFHGVVFLSARAHPVPHLLIQAALNGIAAVLVWRLAVRYLDPRLAMLTIGTWVVLGNRNATRFWITQDVNVFALVLVLLAADLVAGVTPPSAGRRTAAVVLALAAALTYEASALLALTVAIVAVVRGIDRRRAMRYGALVLGLFAAAGLWLLEHSAKRNALRPLAHASDLVAVYFGRGVVPDGAVVLGALVLLSVAWSIWTVLSPSRVASSEERVVVAGAVLLVVGVVPTVVSGFPLGTSGVLDRVNLFGDPGAAMVWAGAIGLAGRLLPRIALGVVTIAVLGVLAVNLGAGLTAYRAAAADGRRLLRAFDAVPAAALRRPIVVAPLPDRRGLAAFIEIDETDLGPALSLRRGLGRPYPPATLAASEAALCGMPGRRFRLVGLSLVAVRC